MQILKITTLFNDLYKYFYGKWTVHRYDGMYKGRNDFITFTISCSTFSHTVIN